jgi:WD40 repeat protein
MILVKAEKRATLFGHKDCIYALAKSKKSDFFYSADGLGLVSRWDLKNPELGFLVAQVPHSVYALCLVEKSNQLIIGHNFEGLHVIDLSNSQELKTMKLQAAQIFDIKSAGDMIFVASSDGVLTIIDEPSWAIKKQIKLSEKSIRAIAIHPKMNELSLGMSDCTIVALDLDSLSIKKRWPAHSNSVFTLEYSPNGHHLISGGRDAHIMVWNTTQDYLLQEKIPAHLYAINSLTFSPSGNYLASGSMDKSVKIWDSDTFKLLKVIDKARHAGHANSINKIIWSDFYGQLISAGDDRTIALWDVQFSV